MPKDVYLIIHIAGIALTIQALAVASFMAIRGDNEADGKPPKVIFITHHLGLVLIILGGFGMIAKLGIGFPWPGWLWVKLTIWIILGISTIFIRKNPRSGRTWFFLIVILVVVASSMAVFKPF